jgi:hypothetical protein
VYSLTNFGALTFQLFQVKLAGGGGTGARVFDREDQGVRVDDLLHGAQQERVGDDVRSKNIFLEEKQRSMSLYTLGQQY